MSAGEVSDTVVHLSWEDHTLATVEVQQAYYDSAGILPGWRAEGRESITKVAGSWTISLSRSSLGAVDSCVPSLLNLCVRVYYRLVVSIAMILFGPLGYIAK